MVKLGLTVQPYGQLNAAFQFSFIQPSGFALRTHLFLNKGVEN